MISKVKLLILFYSIIFPAYAQIFQPKLLNIGDSAPPLQVGKWLKGEPIKKFERGKVYVVDLWATWCTPCIMGMPHLSALARKYRNQVEILGIDIQERKTTSLQKVQAFVDSLGRRMDFHIATDDSGFMVREWYEPSEDIGIPKAFVVDTEGRIAWIGHTSQLPSVLSKIVSKAWDINKALSERNLKKRLEQLDYDANYILNNYEAQSNEAFYGDPDSALLVIGDMIKKEPRMKYAHKIAYHTFSALLKVSPDSAYKYGKQALQESNQNSPYWEIITCIDLIANRFASPPQIYLLGAEAYQAEIDLYPWQYNTPKTYIKMAEWYVRAGEKAKARKSLKEAGKLIKKSKGKFWSGYM